MSYNLHSTSSLTCSLPPCLFFCILPSLARIPSPRRYVLPATWPALWHTHTHVVWNRARRCHSITRSPDHSITHGTHVCDTQRVRWLSTDACPRATAQMRARLFALIQTIEPYDHLCSSVSLCVFARESSTHHIFFICIFLFVLDVPVKAAGCWLVFVWPSACVSPPPGAAMRPRPLWTASGCACSAGRSYRPKIQVVLFLAMHRMAAACKQPVWQKKAILIKYYQRKLPIQNTAQIQWMTFVMELQKAKLIAFSFKRRLHGFLAQCLLQGFSFSLSWCIAK